MDQDLYKKALEASQKGQKYAFATVVSTTLKGTPRKAGAKMLVLEDGSLFGTIGGGRNENSAQKECLKAIKSTKPALVTYDYFGQKGQSICGGQIHVFIEPVEPVKTLIICGAGHISLPLSMIAKICKFRLIIIDNRREFANKKRFEHADKIICQEYKKALKTIKIDNNTHIMIVTQGNEFDYQCLRSVIKSKAAYIGVISSKAKKIKFFKRLKNDGIESKILRKINIPAGKDIGAQTPDEIAVSIAAQLIEKNNNDLVGSDKFFDKLKKGAK